MIKPIIWMLPKSELKIWKSMGTNCFYFFGKSMGTNCWSRRVWHSALKDRFVIAMVLAVCMDVYIPTLLDRESLQCRTTIGGPGEPSCILYPLKGKDSNESMNKQLFKKNLLQNEWSMRYYRPTGDFPKSHKEERNTFVRKGRVHRQLTCVNEKTRLQNQINFHSHSK